MSYNTKQKVIRALNLRSIIAKSRNNHQWAEGGEK